ncbi:unnamed protein product [Cuscuta epithymum]|uniref:Uncharacterized protein n=1 Tax=Cuscuta epithymum TaxID=186058 RepID=A0AAV0DYS6_9ASTE|nr:unnamed protein product [Cuscuta epithymum]
MIAPPGSSLQKTIFCIARLQSQQHYVAIWLDDNAPLPQVFTTWSYYHDASVTGWDIPLLHRIKQFIECRNIVREPLTIVLDD